MLAVGMMSRADIVILAAHEISIGLWRIGEPPTIEVHHPNCHEAMKELLGFFGIGAGGFCDSLGIERSMFKRCENIEFHPGL